MLDFVSHFFCLQFCTICGKYSIDYLCESCKRRIKKYERFCYIEKKIKNKLYCDKIYYCYDYKGFIRKILIDYKFHGKNYLCNYFAKMLLNCKKTYGFFSFYDIIIPVPMSKQKQLVRGYNQTILITDIVAQKTKILNGKNCIKKIKETSTQSLLNAIQRKENVKDAFEISGLYNFSNKKIILFDDIYTTGATVNEISRLIKQNGAKEVLVLVLAKD